MHCVHCVAEKWLGHCVFGPADEDKEACQFEFKSEEATEWEILQGHKVEPLAKPDHTLKNNSGN